MVKRLRKKFVITAMLSLLLIIVVMIGIINAVNLHSMYQDADNLLAILTTNDGRFPGMMNDNFHPPAERFRPDTPFTFDRLNNTRSAEMPYQSRYFVVRFDSTGNITETDLLHIAAITEEDATAFANQIYSSNKEKGMYHSYRYKKAINDDGSCIIVFIDLSSSIFNAFKLLSQSLLVGALALIAMFILVYIFSSQAVAPVVESLEKQKRFITDAGHELKTPLAVISANIDVLELETGKSEWTSSIRNQIKRMNSLVKNLLTLSRMDEERINVVFSDFDLSQTMLETASSFQTVAESKDKKFQVDITEGIHITGDKNAMNQLASLLLDNAIKYSSDKGSIHVTLSRDKNIVFEVSNTCDSIPSGNLDRLFDRFYRADSSRSRETGGYGIGLSVARAIAISHGGNIEAVRDGDKIIRFIVTLPKELPKNKNKG
ncbi:MAG: HAMP domain-containing histidine kinase [Butyrivibrio sp.]|uniref:sensor histidine kinase n=1 Tax=Butyrivibrio sp. TaxID=28121 RepID=UPI0025BEC9A7|nr:HAMP domain-containing sensor histidine kinase [Butyrivibrio sp.]MBQ6589382.1 HAMP domain-containing histidine kinase [Butyrivibrio sp.]